MKKYFYIKNGQRLGPFTYDELWNQNIEANTMVWYEGLQNWQEAYMFPEFVNWFSTLDPVQPANPIQSQPAQNKSYRGIIGVVVFIIGIIIIYSFWLQTNSDSQPHTTQQVITSGTNINNQLVGSWEMANGDFILQFTFSANNTGTLTTIDYGESNTVNFSYNIRGDQLTIAWPDEKDETTYSVNGNKLTIRLEGETLVFTAK